MVKISAHTHPTKLARRAAKCVVCFGMAHLPGQQRKGNQLFSPSAQDTSHLGARLVPGGVDFGLWAPRAHRVELILVDDFFRQDSVEMAADPAGTWRVEVAGIKAGQRYGFRVFGDWDPSRGKRFNPAKLLLDPYARAVAGGVDYAGPIQDHNRNNPFTPDPSDSFGYVPLAVVTEQPPRPRPVSTPKSLADSVIYEAHVRGLTKLHPDVPKELRGSYLGLGHPAMIDYLLGLGVTAVELLPVHHFVSEPFVVEKGLTNYWGYNPVAYFAPYAGYASQPGAQNAEFAAMVDALHAADIEVILDVVYNHTGEGGIEGPTLSMRGIDHASYYRLTNDQLNDYDVTGCGNSVNTANPQTRALVIDSLRYWVEQYGVDGFRFDLATTMIRDHDQHVDQAHPIKAALATDPSFTNTKLIAEPWDVGPYGYQVGSWGAGWSEWNDKFRDHARDFWRGATSGVQELATRLAGSPDLFDSPGRSPQASINFITAHDGFTMRDLVSYDVKHNWANGEANHDGSDNNRS